jgi:hypothetical protein
MAQGANCPRCGIPVSYKEIKGKGIGCGCLLLVFSCLLGIWFPIGTIIGLIPFGIGLYLLWANKSKNIPYCSNCKWQGK